MHADAEVQSWTAEKLDAAAVGAWQGLQAGQQLICVGVYGSSVGNVLGWLSAWQLVVVALV